jgi:hypothetical protein
MLAVSSGGSSAPEARLVELDRLLRDIQAELAPDREPAPLLPDSPAVDGAAGPEDAPARGDVSASAAPPAPAPEPQLQALTALSARLVAAARELLAGYEQVLVGRPAPQPTRRVARPRPETPDVTLSAAPFESLEALREFERAVSGLPGVRDVVIRGYEGADRAIIEVRLDQRNP